MSNLKLSSFLKDMGQPPIGAMIDRKDNDAGYSPDNCRWANRSVQNLNKRNLRMLTIDSKTMAMIEWSRLSGTKLATIWARLNKGWSTKDAVFRPFTPYNKRNWNGKPT